MEDVVVTMPKDKSEDLDSKISAVRTGGSAWWYSSLLPKQISYDSKVFVSCQNTIKGYFTVDIIDSGVTYFADWHDIEPVEMKGFQGVKPRDFDYTEIRKLI